MSTDKTDVLFYSQLGICITGIIFTGTMVIVQPENINVYLPIFTSLLFAWIPSPSTTKKSALDADSYLEVIKLLNQKPTDDPVPKSSTVSSIV